ncbi:uncharacterized protein K452DRAFT_261910 [Aplosporella prunicola CBS 121167]|uniref:UBR-type domain-containing protein n=1 Tax=Aplosporella prunicola CBS 121167 TaxID=1176127 RepID=A0A6A6BVP9_9PEZI|nr:uncharacterized protein K452DRAFT_261910 [Aplosporella prunicola CBS 121167]KAF2147423.1 hypothetical protein K452DRAFT_261910 [Aplosporella prunicola CBS 121167]
MSDAPGSVAKATRSNSISHLSENSQTAQEFINSQLQLEADAREVLPYQFDTCSRPLGPLRQKIWSCLTCNPPPTSPDEPYTPAGVCYSCHVSCHGEHTLVELFAKRNFVCDCGTSRIQSDCPCTLRINEKAGIKGDVRGEEPATTNHYDHNYKNHFCGCGQDYDAHEEKGTMFQCLGLGTVEQGGCGEDWWHPECIVGLPRDWYKKNAEKNGKTMGGEANGAAAAGSDGKEITQNEGGEVVKGEEGAAEEGEEPPNPPGFPEEDGFEHFVCYKCVEAFSWIKRYAGTEGFLPPVYHKLDSGNGAAPDTKPGAPPEAPVTTTTTSDEDQSSKKRKASEAEEDDTSSAEPTKRPRSSEDPAVTTTTTTSTTSSCRYAALPTFTSSAPFSLFFKEDFRSHFCRCSTCFPLLSPHPQLLDEEDTYEPPVSESSASGDGDANGAGTGSIGSRSLLDRGEAALSNMDRVRAIEGVMVYNHLKDQVKQFLKPFAESGRAVGAEDIKAYFENLRGDADGIMQAKGDAEREGGGEGAGGGAGGGGTSGQGKGGEGRGEGASHSESAGSRK